MEQYNFQTFGDYQIMRRFRFVLALALALAGLLVWGWAFFPLPRQTLKWLFTPPQLYSAAAGLGLGETRAAQFSLPQQLRPGEEDRVELNFSSADAASPQLPAAYGACNALAEARLEFPGVNLRPQNSIREPLAPGKPAVFYWSLSAVEPGEYEGKLWLYVTFFCPEDRSETRLALLSAPLQVTVSAAPWGAARWLGGALLALAAGVALVR